VEESLLPRLYRQAPLNSIWEGSGNIQCLDVLRALAREPACVTALRRELEGVAGKDTDYDMAVMPLLAELDGSTADEAGARSLVEWLALALQAGVLLQAGSPAAEPFCRSRLGAAHGLAFGTLPTTLDFGGLIARALST
jgi:putative acyl-CoA dehydrogenase